MELFHLTEFIQKLHNAYQLMLAGTYRPGQVVIVPSHSRPQPKQQPSHNAVQDGSSGSTDGVDVQVFFEAISLIIYSSTSVIRYYQRKQNSCKIWFK